MSSQPQPKAKKLPGPQIRNPNSISWYSALRMEDKDREEIAETLIRSIELYQLAMSVVETNPLIAARKKAQFETLYRDAIAFKSRQPGSKFATRSKFGAEYAALTANYLTLQRENEIGSTRQQLDELLANMKEIWEDQPEIEATARVFGIGQETRAERQMQEGRSRVFEATNEVVGNVFVSREEDARKFKEAIQRKSLPPLPPNARENRVVDQPEDIRNSGSDSSGSITKFGLFRDSLPESIPESLPDSENSRDLGVPLEDIVDPKTAAALGLGST